MAGLLAPLHAAHDRVRARAAEALRYRMAGEDARGRARAIWGSPGEREFSPTDPVWRVHASGSMYLSGLRALMLQALHPVAMAGVVQNSTYRSDPWGRLQQISAYISVTTYGSVEDSRRMTAKVRGVHRRIRGTVGERDYRADDADLLLWVHCAEIDSFLDGYQRYSPTPLSAAEADVYVEQAGHAGRAIGIPHPPESVAELTQTLTSYRPLLDGGPDARDVVTFLRRPSGLDGAAIAGYSALYAGAIATLPAYARDLLGIDWSPLRLRAAARAGALGVRGIEWILSDPQVREDRLSYAQLQAKSSETPADADALG